MSSPNSPTGRQQPSYYELVPMDSARSEAQVRQTAPNAWYSFVTHTRPRYWFCIVVHAMVLLMFLAMVLLWAFGVDHKFTFALKHLSVYSGITNFIATITIFGIIGLTTWAIQGIALHRAFTQPQNLTALHDQTCAWLGPGSAASTVQRNLHPNRHLPSTLLVVFVYFMAAAGVRSTFVASFTFAGFNETVSWSASINALTTTPTKIPTPADLAISQIGAAFFRSSFDYFPSLYNAQLPGLGFGKIYDTLSNTTDPLAQVEVDAQGFSVECGDVPSDNYTINAGLDPGNGSFSIMVTVNTGGRAVGLSGHGPSIANTSGTPSFFVYRFLEEADPFKALPSRNLYVFAATTDEGLLPRDSNNATGTVFSKVVGPQTFYGKVIICSLTTSDSTATIDGLNRPLNRSDELPEPNNHSWAIQQPLASRGHPYEDTFSALYGTPASGDQFPNHDLSHLTLLEVDFSGYWELKDINQRTLHGLEVDLMRTTSISYACLGQYYGFENVQQEVKQGGWDPQPKQGTLHMPSLRARLNIHSSFVRLGFAASVIFFISALLLLGKPPPVGERLIGDPGLLFVLSMLRNSSLPKRMAEGIDDLSALDANDLRKFGATVPVYFFSDQHKLDVPGSVPSTPYLDKSADLTSSRVMPLEYQQKLDIPGSVPSTPYLDNSADEDMSSRVTVMPLEYQQQLNVPGPVPSTPYPDETADEDTSSRLTRPE